MVGREGFFFFVPDKRARSSKGGGDGAFVLWVVSRWAIAMAGTKKPGERERGED